MAIPEKLRIGFIVPATGEVPDWYRETMTQFRNKKEVEVFFISSNLQKKTGPSSIAFRAFQKLEALWFRSASDALRPVSISEWINDRNLIRIDAKTWNLPSSDLSLLNQYQLHLIYSIDFNPSELENISEAATYGLWYLLFGKGKSSGIHLPGFREVMENEAVTQISLLVRKQGRDRIVYSGTTTTVPYSVRNNFNSLAWKSAYFLSFRINELLANPNRFFQSYEDFWKDLPGTEKTPGNLKMLQLFVRNLFRYGKYKTAKDSGKFELHIASAKFDPSELRASSFLKLHPPDGCFWADPFVIYKDGNHIIFFEEWEEKKNRGHISVIERKSDGSFSKPAIVLEQDYHLSYPFVFEKEGSYYMIPETSANRTVELYRAVQFPYRWEKLMNLIEGQQLLDATLYHHNGKWWLFASRVVHPFPSTNDQLFIYYSDKLLSTSWKPHPRNPVITMASHARPAGRIFHHKGKIYRPSQDNASFQYGFGLKLNEILVLSEQEYREKEAFDLPAASFGLKACHHLDFCSGLIVIDGKK